MTAELNKTNLAWAQLRELAQAKIAAGSASQFNFRGYPKFSYVLLGGKDFHPARHAEAREHLENFGAVAIHETGNSVHEFGSPEKYYLIVHAKFNAKNRLLAALHEHTEVMTGSHYAAARAEREFAEKFGMKREFTREKTAQARLVAAAKTILAQQVRESMGRLYYPQLIRHVVQQTALTWREAQKAVQEIVSEFSRRRKSYRKRVARQRGI